MREIEETDVDLAVDDVETGDSDTIDETTEDTVDEDTEAGESDAEDSDAAEGEEDAEEAEDEEPPTRKPRTKADWVAFRRGKKLEKRQEASDDEEQGEAEDEDDDLSDISEEDARVIDKVVSRRLAPFEQQQEILAVKSEIDEFIATNPDFKPYATKALKWSQHPSWKNVPTKQLMFAAAGDNLLKMGAKRSKAAAEKARRTSTGKGTSGNVASTKSVEDMTDEEFAAYNESVKYGR